MTDVLVTGFGPRERYVLDAAHAIARLLNADVRRLHPHERSEREVQAREVLEGLAAQHTLLVVVPGRRARSSLCWQVLASSDKPVLVVPPHVHPDDHPIRLALLPLDGTAESATAVAGATALLAEAGVELLVLHVFGETTVPKYWDQPTHARQAWGEEFLARYCTMPGVRMELRVGLPDEGVLRVAAEAGADLIALGWSRRLDRGRAKVVRRTVVDSPVPVLLVPMIPSG